MFHPFGSKSIKREKTGIDKVVIGILSHSENVCRRNVQRKTTIQLAKNYTKLDIHFVFVLDTATPALLAEQQVHNDIIFLNITELGWNRQFDLKLYLWFKYAVVHFPDLLLVGRMDDDLFLCMPQALDRLNSIKHKKLYYGYGEMCEGRECLDDVWLFFGSEMARTITNQTHCLVKKVKSCLATGSTPGRVIHSWVEKHRKKDYVLVNEFDTKTFIYYFDNHRHPPGSKISKKKKERFQRFQTRDFCNKYMFFHKASPKEIYKMHQNNSALTFNNVIQTIPEWEIKNVEHCT